VKKKTASQILDDPSPRPETNDPHIGIEIEFFCTKGRRDLAELFANSSVSGNVSLGDDGSIEPYDDIGAPNCVNCGQYDDGYSPKCGCGFRKYFVPYELRILCKQFQRKKVISEVCRILRSVNARVNNTCGLHMHLDMRGKNDEQRKEVYRNLYYLQDMMTKVVESSRRHNSYCRLNDTKYLAEAMRNRYSAINATALRKYGTLEVRLHHGTISARDLSHWADLLVHAAKAKNIKQPLSDIKTVAQKLKLSRYAYKHFKKKEIKFGDAS
jgi:hypothetical protein